MSKLTAKQQAFVDEYLIDLNATQAAIRAGYSVKRASEIGYQLLQKTTVSEAIAVAMAERSKRTSISQDRILQQLAKIAFSDIKDVMEWRNINYPLTNWEGMPILDPDGNQETDPRLRIILKESSEVDGAIIQEISETNKGGMITHTVKLNDRMKALELLGKHLGMWTEKHQVEFVTPTFVEDVPADD
jgi:phage terminase small subunit